MKAVARELERLAQRKNLVHDSAQRAVAGVFDELTGEWLRNPTPEPATLRERVVKGMGAVSEKYLSWTFRPRGPRGLYVHGSPGNGKTLLMDCFYRVAKEELWNQQNHKVERIHFHDFMLNVHESLHRTKSMEETCRAIGKKHVLCFDEFQVTDVADAVLLHQLFDSLLNNHGTIIVATSNRAPHELYQNGLNRKALFEPFEALLFERCQILDMNSLGQGQDYRFLQGAKQQQCYLYPASSPSVQQQLDSLVEELSQGSLLQRVPVSVAMGRSIDVNLAANGRVARSSFSKLCRNAVGAADYIALAESCSTLVLEAVPRLNENLHNEAKRFITLVDIFYDRQRRLVLTAECALEELFADIGIGLDKQDENPLIQQAVVSGEGGSSGRSSTMLGEDFEWSATGRTKASLGDYAGRQEVGFAFRRALSRLQEMQTEVYWSQAVD